jgi:hypothetical protein
MGQFLRINGDYNIKAGDGSKITLDTGPASSGGEVRITGNLTVEGDTTTVQAENLSVEDNIIVVNFGETGAGITLNYSGIQADRGTLDPVGILYDEIIDAWTFVKGGPAINEGDPATPFNFDESRIKVKEILTESGTDFGDLTLIGSGSGLVKVTGTITYEQEIINRDLANPGSMDDVLPNKRYVDNAILNNPTFQIVSPQNQDTLVIISDKEITPNISTVPGSLAYFTANTPGFDTNGESAVSVVVDNKLSAQFYENRLEVTNLEIGGGPTNTEITTKSGITNENVIIRTQGTGKLQTNYAIQLERIGTSGETPPVAFPFTPVTPAYVSGSTLIFAANPSIGTTGLYFTNDSLIERYRTGELISKNKALVFSMIF